MVGWNDQSTKCPLRRKHEKSFNECFRQTFTQKKSHYSERRMMNLRILCRWNTPDIDALTISSSTYSGQLLPIICSQRSRASMYKGPLTHSLHRSEFVELTLIKTTNITRKTKKTRNLKKIIVFLALHNIDSYICDNKRKMPHY